MNVPDIHVKRRTIKSLISQPLTSRFTKVLDHPDPSLIGIKGLIVKDTSNTLQIKSKHTTKTVPKLNGLFQFSLENMAITVRGGLLIGSIKKRKKRRLRNW